MRILSKKQQKHLQKLRKLHLGVSLSQNHRNKISKSNTTFNITKKFLENNYISNGLSQTQIAKNTGCSQHLIALYMKKYKIKARNHSELTKGKLNPFHDNHMFKGKNNPNFGNKWTNKQRKKVSKRNIKWHTENKKEFIRINRQKVTNNPIRNKNLSLSKGGTGTPYDKSEYSKEFRIVRSQIRQRDNYTCQNQECNRLQIENETQFDVHHIDYHKPNNRKSNLITLCRRCHAKANTNRDYWFAYYSYIMENCK